jgi:hypothetical protein
LGVSKTILEPMVRYTLTVHLSCTRISTISKRTKLSLEPRQLGVPSGASKMIFEPMVRLAQTVHLYCTDTYTVFEQKEVRFHITHVTEEFHLIRPNRFLSLWYVRRKPGTYLASRLALSLKGPK